MALFSCECRRKCTLLAIIAAIIGVLAAFLQVTAVIAVTPVFVLVAFGIAVAYLGILTAAAVLTRRTMAAVCQRTLDTLLVGILGTVLFAVILLAVGIVATGVFSAILVGLTAGFFTLMLSGAACLIRCLVAHES